MSSLVKKIIPLFFIVLILSGCSHTIKIPENAVIKPDSNVFVSGRIIKHESQQEVAELTCTVPAEKEIADITQIKQSNETTAINTTAVVFVSDPTTVLTSTTINTRSATKPESTSKMRTETTQTTFPPTTVSPTTTIPTTQPTTTAPTTQSPTTEKQTEPVESYDISFPIHYSDDGITIDITKQWYVGAWCYIAHIRMSDYSRMKTGMAYGSYDSYESPLSYASRNGCLLTVNGDYAEGLGLGVIRNGSVYSNRTSTARALYSQYSGELDRNQSMLLSDLAYMGYTDSFEFGASELVVDGKSIYLRKDGGKSAQRTLIGTTGESGDIYLVVTEGRYSDGESRGLQYWEAGDLLESLGCYFGIALDGGGSSAMVWKNHILNHAENRKVTNFIYVTY